MKRKEQTETFMMYKKKYVSFVWVNLPDVSMKLPAGRNGT